MSAVVWVAVCLPCWRRVFGRWGDPPQEGGFPEEVCVFCRRRTNHGIYVEDLEARQAQAAAADDAI